MSSAEVTLADFLTTCKVEVDKFPFKNMKKKATTPSPRVQIENIPELCIDGGSIFKIVQKNESRDVSLLVPYDDVRRTFMSTFIRAINEDDFDTFRSFMKKNATDDFIFIDELIDKSDNHLFPKKIQINGIESIISFLTSVSDSLPDKILSVNNVVIRSYKNSSSVIIGEIRLLATRMFEIILKDFGKNFATATVEISPTKSLDSGDAVVESIVLDSYPNKQNVPAKKRKVTKLETVKATAVVITDKPEGVPDGIINHLKSSLNPGWINVSRIKTQNLIFDGYHHNSFVFDTGNPLIDAPPHADFIGSAILYLNEQNKIYKFEMNRICSI